MTKTTIAIRDLAERATRLWNDSDALAALAAELTELVNSVTKTELASSLAELGLICHRKTKVAMASEIHCHVFAYKQAMDTLAW